MIPIFTRLRRITNGHIDDAGGPDTLSQQRIQHATPRNIAVHRLRIRRDILDDVLLAVALPGRHGAAHEVLARQARPVAVVGHQAVGTGDVVEVGQARAVVTLAAAVAVGGLGAGKNVHDVVDTDAVAVAQRVGHVEDGLGAVLGHDDEGPQVAVGHAPGGGDQAGRRWAA